MTINDDHFTVRPPVRRPKADEQVYVATQLQKRQNHNALAFLPFRGVWKSDSSAGSATDLLYWPVPQRRIAVHTILWKFKMHKNVAISFQIPTNPARHGGASKAIRLQQ